MQAENDSSNKATFESGNWHDASELSRKDAIKTDARPTQETVIAEKAINPNYKGTADAPAIEAEIPQQIQDAAENAKEAVKETAADARDQAQGIAAAAQQKASEVLHAAYDKAADLAAPVLEKAGDVMHKAADLAAPVLNTASAAKEVIVNTAHAAQHKAAELTGLAAPDLKDALQNMKEPEPTQGGSDIPKGALSDISSAELLLQKANIKFTADREKIADSSLPLYERAAAAADAVVQKATALYETGVIAASNLLSKKTDESAQQQPQAPAQASQ